MIYNIYKIPFDENNVKQYVIEKHQYHGKLYSSVQMSGNQNLHNLKLKVVFNWVHAKNTSIDRMRSALKHTIGFSTPCTQTISTENNLRLVV